MTATLCVALVAVAYGCVLAGQASEPFGPEHTILRRAVASTEVTGSEWRFIPAVCTCPPLMPEQVGVATGAWWRNSPDGPPTVISVTVYAIAAANAAARYMRVRRTGRQFPEGWTLQPTNFADDAYAAIYRDGRHYDLSFRKGRFLVSVSGSNHAEVERFARPVLDAVSPIE